MENQVKIQEVNKNIAKKPKKNKLWIVILIIVLSFLASIPIIFLVFAGLMIWIDFNVPYDGSTQKITHRIDVDTCSNEIITLYYDTIEEAIEAEDESIIDERENEGLDINNIINSHYKDQYYFKNELVKWEDDDAVTSVFCAESDDDEMIRVYTFEKKDGKYSNCIRMYAYELKNMITAKALINKAELDFDEQIALDLMSSIWLNQASYANDGVMIPYGLTDNEDIYNLTIMGEEPTDIISFDYNGKTYYFWYFDSEMIDEQIRDKAENTYTCIDVIDWVQIEVSDN